MRNTILFLCIMISVLSNPRAFSRDSLPPGSPGITYIQNAEARRQTSLNGAWPVIVDPLETGFYSHRYDERADGFFVDAKQKSPGELLEYNFDTGMRLSVPGDWNTQREKLYYYENTLWYKRDFTVGKKAGRRYFLHFGAINYHALIYVNRKKAAGHEGGYTSFDVEVTDLVSTGSNLLVIKVENIRRPDRIPPMNMDWWNYGGITRSVSLIEVGETFIAE